MGHLNTDVLNVLCKTLLVQRRNGLILSADMSFQVHVLLKYTCIIMHTVMTIFLSAESLIYKGNPVMHSAQSNSLLHTHVFR